jgi:hypothetical protein
MVFMATSKYILVIEIEIITRIVHMVTINNQQAKKTYKHC